MPPYDPTTTDARRRDHDPRRPPLSQVFDGIRTIWGTLLRKDDNPEPSTESVGSVPADPGTTTLRPAPEANRSRPHSPPSKPLTPQPLTGPEPTTLEQTALADIAVAYSGFVEQTLHHTARVCLNTLGRRPTSATVGQLMGWLSRMLFIEEATADQIITSLLGDHLDGTDAVAHSLRGLHHEAAALRQRIADQSLTHRWDFSMTAGLPLNERRQEPWGRHHPDQATQCLAAPGLILDGRLYCRQRLVTTPQSKPKMTTSPE